MLILLSELAKYMGLEKDLQNWFGIYCVNSWHNTCLCQSSGRNSVINHQCLPSKFLLSPSLSESCLHCTKTLALTLCLNELRHISTVTSPWQRFLFIWLTVCLCVIGKPKQKAMGKAVKTPSLTWMEALPPPPPIGELEQCEPDDQPPEHEDMDIGWVSFPSHIFIN